jgi:NAD(P)-dependent dehydrogenase (short-subunit alcohol dehydrogenase family)
MKMDIKQTHNVSMKGKKVIITGPTSGFGKEIAFQLAALDAEIILACRDLQRGEQTVNEITRRTGKKNFQVMYIDTSDQKSIHEFAKEYSKRFSRLDILINNAGINRAQRQMSVDGIELTFATNVLGYFILTQDLLDLLRASVPARIVNVASTFASDLDLADLQFKTRSYKGRKAYAQSKACNRMLTWALARRLKGCGVTVNAMAPGLVVKTSLYRDTALPIRLILRCVGLFKGRSVAEGADTAIWLASSPEVEGMNGKFFDQRREIRCQFRNEEAEEKLWSLCDGMIKDA